MSTIDELEEALRHHRRSIADIVVSLADRAWLRGCIVGAAIGHALAWMIFGVRDWMDW